MIKRILRLFFIISILFFQIGCNGGLGQDSNVSINIINTPIDLPKNLANRKIVFYNLDKKLARITSLDQKDVDTFNLAGNDIYLSSNYKYLAYTNFTQINLIDTLTGEEKILVSIQDDIPNALDISTPSFSPENTKLIFRVDFLNSEFKLATVDLMGNNVQILDINGFNTRPQYSPNGDWILTICESDKAVGFNICIVDTITMERTHLTDIDGYHWAHFSPNGDKIVFSQIQSRMLQKDLVGLYTMNINGTDITMLLDWNVSILGFSDNGQSIIFRKASEDRENDGVYVIDIDGENLMHLAYFDDEFLDMWQ